MKSITEYLLYELEHNITPQPVVTIIADLNYDYIYISPPLEGGREVLISDYTRNIAGAGGIVACGMAKLGAEVHFLTELGDDEDGNQLYREITNYGVYTDGIRIVADKRSPFTLIFTSKQEHTPRQVASFLGTSLTLSIDSMEYKKYVEKSHLVYSCNYFLLKKLREEIRFVFKYAREKKVFTSYDANAGDEWDNERALRTLRQSIYPYTDIIFLNEYEAVSLTGIHDPQKSIQSIGPESVTVVIKLGSRGSIIRHWNKMYRIDAFPLRERIQDTVGAGDSFQAAFLYYYLKKFPIELCGVLGAANAASSVLHRGGTDGQCDNKEIAQFVKRYQINDRRDGYVSIQL
jgi:sugar/nucleoside kinase (ribokinase family)